MGCQPPVLSHTAPHTGCQPPALSHSPSHRVLAPRPESQPLTQDVSPPPQVIQPLTEGVSPPPRVTQPHASACFSRTARVPSDLAGNNQKAQSPPQPSLGCCFQPLSLLSAQPRSPWRALWGPHCREEREGSRPACNLLWEQGAAFAFLVSLLLPVPLCHSAGMGAAARARACQGCQDTPFPGCSSRSGSPSGLSGSCAGVRPHWP